MTLANKPFGPTPKSVNPLIFQIFDYQIFNNTKFEKWKLNVNPITPKK